MTIAEENEILKRYHDIISKEEPFWKQRSRCIWLMEGDKNTRFFHMSTIKHKASNRIKKLMVDNVELVKEEEIRNEAKSFFSDLLCRDQSLDDDVQNSFLWNIPCLIDEHKNAFLTSIPSDLKIRNVVFSFEDNKAPRPDDFPMFFFQEFRDIVGKDVSNGVKEFFGARKLLKKINGTFIALIPKSQGVDSMDKFRPISLCNSFYKVISKVLTSRLLNVLPSLISHQQNGFVLGRQILDSTIIHENIHSLAMAKKQGFILKLDLSKAYDRVDWSFLVKVLLAFGFFIRCVDLFKHLISSTSFFFLVDGSPSPFFKASRGLRQGDPISPILFIIMAKCFGRYMESMVTRGIFKGLQPSSIDHTCSHQ